MGSISMCPKCHGRLVAVSERTGGFSGTKAVVGAVVAGPVGVAAGALGKKLVVLQCEKCGYQIETTQQEAQEAERFGSLYAAYVKSHTHTSRLTKQPSIEELGYKKGEFAKKGYAAREEERKKIGLDIEEIEASIKTMEKEFAQAEADGLAEIARLEQEKAQKATAREKMGFFKFSEKKAAQAALDDVSGQLNAAIRKQQDMYQQLDSKIKALRAEYVERCRLLAYNALNVYCPDHAGWSEFAEAVYSILSDVPMKPMEISRAYGSDLTALQISKVINEIGNPFVSCTPDCGWYFGVDGSGDIRQVYTIKEKMARDAALDKSNPNEWRARRRQDAALAASKDHVVMLRADGTVAAAGNNDSGQCNVSDWKNIVAVYAEDSVTYGIKEDGSIAVTGHVVFDWQREVAEWTNMAALALGSFHVLGLKRDGTVISVGDPEFDRGQTAVSDWKDIVAISTSPGTAAGLRRDGTVAAAGDDADSLKGFCNIAAISSSIGSTYCIRNNYTVAATKESIIGHRAEVAAITSGITVLRTYGEVSPGCPGSEEVKEEVKRNWRNIVAVADSLEIYIGICADGTARIAGNVPDNMKKEVAAWKNLLVVPEVKAKLEENIRYREEKAQKRALSKELAETPEWRTHWKEFREKYSTLLNT